jgi:single-stranded DNA-binding protein
MDCNIVVLSGRLAAEPEIRAFPSGATLARLLVTVRSEQPRRRVDVVPVSWWDPPPHLGGLESERGSRVWVVGSAQRRFWSTDGDKRSRIEIVAHEVRAVKGSPHADSGEPSGAA